MKYSIISLLLAATSAVVAQPTKGKYLKPTKKLPSHTTIESTLSLAEDPAFVAAYNAIVKRVPAASIEKRACGGLDPCCDTKTGCDSRDPCYANCASIPGTGSLGCVAGT